MTVVLAATPTADQLREQLPTRISQANLPDVEMPILKHITNLVDARNKVLEGVEGRNIFASEARAVDKMDQRRIELEQLLLDVRGQVIPQSEYDKSNAIFGGVDMEGVLFVDGDGSGRTTRGLGGGTRGAYAKGRALRSGQTFEGYVRSRGLVDEAERPAPLSFGKYLRGLSTGRWDNAENEQRAMSEGTTTAGGFFVPTLLSSTIIDLARADTALDKVGAQFVPMENQKVDVPKWSGDPTAAWHSENAAITPSDGVVGKVSLVAQTLAALVVVSMELLEDAPQVSDELNKAFAAAFALKLDLAGLRGSGTAPEPRGVRNTSGITTTSLGTNGASLSWDHVIDGVGVLQDANEPVSGIISAPRAERTLAKVKDSQGRYLAPPNGFGSIPRATTSQLPVNLTVGTSNDCGEVYLGNWSQLIVGIRTQLLVRPLVERYVDNGQAGFIAWARADIAVARPGAFNVLTGVRP